MKRIAITVGAAMVAIVPATIGFLGNASLSERVPVRVPSQAIVVDDPAGPSKHVRTSAKVEQRATGKSRAGDDNRGKHQRVEAGDDNRGQRKHVEAGDDNGGQRKHVEAGDDSRGEVKHVETGDDSGGKGRGSGNGGKSGGDDD